MLLEDAFWMERSSAALLSHLIPLIESVPLLFCVVTRGENDSFESPIRMKAAQEHPHRYHEVILNPLSPADADCLVEHLLKASNLPRRIHRAVREASEGNPLFAEELAQSFLVDDGILQDGEPAHSSPTASGRLHFELPSSIKHPI